MNPTKIIQISAVWDEFNGRPAVYGLDDSGVLWKLNYRFGTWALAVKPKTYDTRAN